MDYVVKKTDKSVDYDEIVEILSGILLRIIENVNRNDSIGYHGIKDLNCVINEHENKERIKDKVSSVSD